MGRTDDLVKLLEKLIEQEHVYKSEYIDQMKAQLSAIKKQIESKDQSN
jgi:hypothetical protein